MSESILDLEDALQRVQDDKELLLELFEIFEDDFKDKQIQLAEAVQAKNFGKIRDIAHSMKGAASNISAKKIYTTLFNLEQSAENKEDIEKLGEFVKTVGDQFSELKIHLNDVRKKLKSG